MIPALDRLSLKLIIGIVAALMLAMLVADRNRWKSKTAYCSDLLASARAAHAATVASYRAAAERARQADAANAARVKASQAAINERTANDYETRIAAARASAGRLRRQAGAGGDSGGGGTAPVPGLSVAAEGVAQGAGQDRLPPAEALIATEQAIQLDELIKWVRRQHAVSVDGVSGGQAAVAVAPPR
ncbi:MAG TPA: hypothetical protein VFO51_09460 [Sphingomicrobium sp.]|nr:hypothetical protein [Sphingomicrobium sp.]